MRIDKAKVKEIIEEELGALEGLELEEGFLGNMLRGITSAMPWSAVGRAKRAPKPKPSMPAPPGQRTSMKTSGEMAGNPLVDVPMKLAAQAAPYTATGPAAAVGGAAIAGRGAMDAWSGPGADKRSTGEKLAHTALAATDVLPAGKVVKAIRTARKGATIATGGKDPAHTAISAMSMPPTTTTPAAKAVKKAPPTTTYASKVPKVDYGGQTYKTGAGMRVSEGTRSIDFIKTLVEQELREIDGGIMDPNMVPFVPHREPAADPPKESEEPTEVDHLYRLGVKARLATEALVEALDDPIYDQAYDSAFKATMALRDSLNSLIDQGAKPLDSEQLVAPPEEDQPRQDAPGYAIPFAGITYSGDNV